MDHEVPTATSNSQALGLLRSLQEAEQCSSEFWSSRGVFQLTVAKPS